MSTNTNVITQENIVAQFPKEVREIAGAPSPEEVFNLKNDVEANASAIPSSLGGGLLGCLGLACAPETYADHSDTPFAMPENPGPKPIYPQNCTVAIRGDIKENYETNSNLYLSTKAVDIALKNYIIKCIDDRYIRALRQANTQYGNCTVLDLLTHIIMNYGPADPQELTANVQRLNKEWNIATSFEDLIDQVENAVNFAKLGGQPFTSPQIINSAYTNVFNTGAYMQALHDWDLKEDNEKTWANFKNHMLIAQRKRNKEQTVTTGCHGYANQAILLNIKAALAADRAQSYATANAASQINIQLQEAMKKIAQLEQQNANGQNTKCPPNDTYTGQNKRQKNNGNHPGRNTWDDYCWTHGYMVAPGHNSGTCNKPGLGHKKDATANNMMGGSIRGHIHRKPADK